MWEILQFKCESKPQKEKAYQLFDQSLKPALDQQNTETSILEVYVATTIEISINTSDGGQAAPAGSIKAGHRDYGNNDTISPRPDDLIPETDWLRPDTSWMWTNVSNGNNDTPGESGAPLAMFDLNASTWWNFGNL
jgi:hypothetical protein